MSDLQSKFKSALLKKETLRALEETSDSRFIHEIHNYEKDTLVSTACKYCDQPRESRNHPHPYRKAEEIRSCVCTLPKSSLIHQMTGI
jgi:hypothetical protein